ncbi:MAG TPA: cation transporter [Jatrophihabitans sp.]|jgi:copper chaperone
MSSTEYAVTGLTCGHCVAAVTEELCALPGVHKVEVALIPNAISTMTVTSDAPLTDLAVSAALDEAGSYALA